MELAEARELFDLQAGVAARRQLVGLGATPADLRRWLRRQQIVAVHPGVYVNHTGPLTWASRAWAAVQYYWPSALCDRSAVDLAGDQIHVAVSVGRTPVRRGGVTVHWLTDLEDRVQWNLGPPRVRFEDALLGLCAQAPTRVSALVIAADACRRRRTTPERLLAHLAERGNLRHRSWLREVLLETAAGVQSALESSYLRKVERAHGLPRGRRQVREATSNGIVYRDLVYDRQRVIVELDGRVGHELSTDRWKDMDRDLEAATHDYLTVRVGWRQVEEQPCETAHRVGQVLRLRGWRGRLRCCGPACRSNEPIGATG